MATVGDLVINLGGKNETLTQMIEQSKRGLSALATEAQFSAAKIGDAFTKMVLADQGASRRLTAAVGRQAGDAMSGIGGGKIAGKGLSALAPLANRITGGISSSVSSGMSAASAMGASSFAGPIALAVPYGTALVKAGQHARALRIESEKLDVGVVMLQQMERAAGRLGIETGSVTKGVTRLQNSIVEGLSSKEKQGEFKQRGLDPKELIGMMPDEALEKTAKAIMGIGNASIRSHAEIQLFGKAGKELEPILREIAEGRISNKKGMMDWSGGDVAALETYAVVWEKVKNAFKWTGLQLLKPGAWAMQKGNVFLTDPYIESANRARRGKSAADAKAYQEALTKAEFEEGALKALGQARLARIREEEATKQRLLKQPQDLLMKWNDARAKESVIGATDRETEMFRDIAQQQLDMRRAGIPEATITAKLMPLVQAVPGQARFEAMRDAGRELRNMQAMTGGGNEYQDQSLKYLASGVPKNAVRELTDTWMQLKQTINQGKTLFNLDDQIRKLTEDIDGLDNTTREYNRLIANGVGDEQAITDALKVGGKQDQLRALQLRKETMRPWEKMGQDLGELESLKSRMDSQTYLRRKRMLMEQANVGIDFTPEEQSKRLKEGFDFTARELAADLAAKRITQEQFDLWSKTERRRFVDQSMRQWSAPQYAGAAQKGSQEAWHTIMGAMGEARKGDERKRLEEVANKQMDAAIALENAGKAIVAAKTEPFDGV